MGLIAEYVGRETQIEALGQVWTVGRWDLRVWDEFLVWCREQLPDPLEVAERSCLRLLAQERGVKAELEACTDDARKAELRGKVADLSAMQAEVARQGVARASSYLAVNSPEVQSMINSVRGGTRLLYLLLKPHHPDITEDDAFTLLHSMDPNEVQKALAASSGKVPAEKQAKN